jgi:hypothetical protein
MAAYAPSRFQPLFYSYCYILGFFYSLNKLTKMEIEDIEVIVMIVQFKDGSAHQVLTTKENKRIALNIVASADGKLTLDKALAPVIFEYAD